MRNMVLHFPSKLTDLEEELQLKYAKLSKEEKTIGTFKLPKGLERELKDTQITDIY